MKRGKFSLSNYKLLSCDMGELVPVGITEVLPGDTMQQATSLLLRCSPLVTPVMHPVRVQLHHWYVPHRLTWEDFEDFITGGPDGMDVSEFPTITFGGGSGAAVGSLADYLGVPTGVDGIEVSALPFRAYALIYNEWYRDQDLITELAISEASGADSTTSTGLVNSCWEKDYFTSARPWEQKGPTVTVPLGGSAPLSPTNPAVVFDITAGGGTVDSPASVQANVAASASPTALSSIEGAFTGAGSAAAATDEPLYTDLSGVTADLSGASAVTVNVLREALALQRYEEARARYGSRYTEYLRYLGVRSSDARLQRPEYLGGGKATISFSEVLQTAEGTNPVGELRGHGISSFRTNRYRRFFEEHGYVLSLCTVRPRTIYADGLCRHWNRRTKEDFWQRELQHIGQQAILNKEIYAAAADPEDTFGYQDRYDEYRRSESTIAGEFRESTLDSWHLARLFSSEPALNDTFVECVPTQRVFASETNDVLYLMARHSIQARRMVAQVGKSYIY